MGEDIGASRSMSNPNQFNDPDTYLGTHWFNTENCTPHPTQNDNCGVQDNSLVISHWFFLLSEGGTGTNDIGNSFGVGAIGINNAARIVYRTQSVILQSNVEQEISFTQFREASITAASNIFGSNSNEVAQVTNAWHAVGVGDSYQYEISGPSCIVPHELTSTYTIENLPAGASVTWSASNSNLQLVSGQGTSTAVFQKNGNDASCVVKADISVWGITVVLYKTVWLGKPEKPTYITGFPYNGMNFGSNTSYDFYTNSTEAGSYEWSVGGGTIVSGQGTNLITVLTANANSGDNIYFTVSVKAVNACGCSPIFSRTGYVVKGEGPAYKVYPNPANDYVFISFNQQSMREYAERKGQKAQGCELVVYNGYNQIMYKTRTKEDEIQIDTRNFPAGTYYLHVTYGDKTEKSQLVIE